MTMTMTLCATFDSYTMADNISCMFYGPKELYKIINKESPVYLQDLIRGSEMLGSSLGILLIFIQFNLELKPLGKDSSHQLSSFGTP